MRTGTVTQRVGALALVAALIMSVFAAGPAAAAASNVSIEATDYDVDEPTTAGVTFNVTADAGGISNQTLSVAVVDESASSTTATYERQVDVAANQTKAVTIDVSPEQQGIAPGTYSLQANVDGVTATSTLTVNEVADPSVTLDQSEYSVNGSAATVNATLSAGGQDRVGPVEFVVLNDSGGVVHSETMDDYSLSASSTADESFTIAPADVNAGNYTVEAVYAGTSASAPLTVENTDDAPVGGGVISDAAGDPVALGGVAVVIVLIGLAARAE
ncbi:hypothetical protein HLRTI_001303 [Halorhabdus tiamatea SARL4B]|uniref:Uncharacterized protein n=1 Tax=Halorhabdus tiamatea SARL4B TaxID=1033806 RepID=U2DLF1_9EURY|nr:hypothetical protein [Halorhabdus tiamatea]ERJ06597.1 hypothetical protein HLRTI_001303 [Halorhabdus tiamatea SARL4B]